MTARIESLVALVNCVGVLLCTAVSKRHDALNHGVRQGVHKEPCPSNGEERVGFQVPSCAETFAETFAETCMYVHHEFFCRKLPPI